MNDYEKRNNPVRQTFLSGEGKIAFDSGYKVAMEEKNSNCPFCNDKDFDPIGLKYHLENHCEIYRQTKQAQE